MSEPGNTNPRRLQSAVILSMVTTRDFSTMLIFLLSPSPADAARLAVCPLLEASLSCLVSVCRRAAASAGRVPRGAMLPGDPETRGSARRASRDSHHDCQPQVRRSVAPPDSAPYADRPESWRC